MIQNDTSAPYTAIGKKVIKEQTFYKTQPRPRKQDPLAQTFTLNEDKYISSIDIYFATKDESADICLEIRNVVNGYPSTDTYFSKILNSKDVKTSPDGTVATRFTFPDPILLSANTEYCFVLLTPSSNYRVWVGKMGGTNVLDGTKVVNQTYSVGVLFSSSNASTWTAHQEYDMKFVMNTCKFKSESILAFEKMEVEKITKVVLTVNQLVPRGGSIYWEWSKDKVTWYSLSSDSATELGEELDGVHIRARLTSNGSSPAIENGVGSVAMAHKGNGIYVSRELVASAFNKVVVYVDMYTPSGTNQVLEYTLDGSTWLPFGSSVEQNRIDEMFTQYKFEVTVAKRTSVRVRIKQETSLPTITPKARRLMVHVS